MTESILITGCAGFLGFNLAQKLLAEGHVVIGVDDFCTGQMAHIDKLAANKNFQFVEQSITEPLKINTAVTQIYNFACPASPPMYQKMPLHTLNSCSVGILNVLALAKQNNAQLVHASTSEIYGDPSVSPQPENYWGHVNPIGPRACYDEGKRFAESLITNFAQQHNVAAKIARIFNTYGPGMRYDDGRVITNFITQALHKKPLTIFGNGGQTRSFCYVDDLIEGLTKLMHLPAEKYPGPINLGNPHPVNIKDLAALICQILAVPLQIINDSLPQDDPVQRCPDISLAQKLLGWNPQIGLITGLQKTAAYLATILRL